jgi:hypothetical protein
MTLVAFVVIVISLSAVSLPYECLSDDMPWGYRRLVGESRTASRQTPVAMELKAGHKIVQAFRLLVHQVERVPDRGS